MSKLSLLTTGLLAISLTACIPSPSPKSAADDTDSAQGASSHVLVLRTYQVPAGEAVAIRRTLDALFRVKSEQVIPARIEVLPDQQLAVYATEATHQSVATVLTQLKPSVKTKPLQAKISYWLVLAQPTENSAEPIGGLVEVKAALDQITQQHGALQFELLERLELTSVQRPLGSAGHVDPATVRGNLFVVDQEINQQQDCSELKLSIQKIRNASAELNSKLPNDYLLSTRLTATQPDQLLVIGSNASDIAKGQYLYAIVRIQQQ
ncbi:hypothetical protein A5320_02950 [Rheinheimera sp. SA_1]|uniref:hypothetical protein n=1 Tax=Rheinheimera sp. SA_1 TaxID=1827365 RepID=UPI0007FD4E95|nr:hypothetical protein [Rheinheimera sp. SA_1]OBP16383.1 hypothetical protein A5320_02950 [Rheinheimera sp. SA_1]